MIQVNGIARPSPTPRGVKKVTGSAVNGGGVDNFEEANKDIVDDIIVDYVDDEVGMIMMMIMVMMMSFITHLTNATLPWTLLNIL